MELKSQWAHCDKELIAGLMGAARRERSEIIHKVYILPDCKNRPFLTKHPIITAIFYKNNSNMYFLINCSDSLNSWTSKPVLLFIKLTQGQKQGEEYN